MDANPAGSSGSSEGGAGAGSGGSSGEGGADVGAGSGGSSGEGSADAGGAGGEGGGDATGGRCETLLAASLGSSACGNSGEERKCETAARFSEQSFSWHVRLQTDDAEREPLPHATLEERLACLSAAFLGAGVENLSQHVAAEPPSYAVEFDGSFDQVGELLGSSWVVRAEPTACVGAENPACECDSLLDAPSCDSNGFCMALLGKRFEPDGACLDDAWRLAACIEANGCGSAFEILRAPDGQHWWVNGASCAPEGWESLGDPGEEPCPTAP